MNFELDEQQRDFAASIDAALGAADVPGRGPRLGRRRHRTRPQGMGAAGRPRRHRTGRAGDVRRHRRPPGRPGGRRWNAWAAGACPARSPNPLPWHRFCSPTTSAALHWPPGELIATVAMPPQAPRAVDADTAGLILVAGDGRCGGHRRRAGTSRSTPAESCSTSPRPARRLKPIPRVPTSSGRSPPPRSWSAPARPCWTGQSSTPSSAPSSAGRSAPTRRSSTSSPTCTSPSSWRARWCTARRCRSPTARRDTARDVSAAKVAAADAALLAARSALQTHGAIGFTQEHDLSLLLLRVQALRSAWGDPALHRRRLLEML